MEIITLPRQFEAYISQKLQKNCLGGRPHFIKDLAKERDPKEEILNILELAWLKNRPIGSIARKYKTTYQTIWRIFRDLLPWKEALVNYLKMVPRRKIFYNKDANTSDYETVQAYIKHGRRNQLKKYKEVIGDGRKIWVALGYKDPGRWTQEDVDDFLLTYQDRPGQQYNLVKAVRALAPQLKSTMKLGKYHDKIKLHKSHIFGKEVNMIHEALTNLGLTYHQDIFDLHITIGAREGKYGSEAGICGITWERFKKDFTRVDDFESKVRGGIWWRDCPVDLFFEDLPERLNKLWIKRGKPSNKPIILHGYPELLKIYKEIRTALHEYYKGKIDPSLLKELTSIKPHSADKIHVNMLWEADVPLETVAGEYEGHGEGIGLVGRGWLNIETIRKYYLSLTRRSKKFQKIMVKIHEYRKQFQRADYERVYNRRFDEEAIFHRSLLSKSLVKEKCPKEIVNSQVS